MKLSQYFAEDTFDFINYAYVLHEMDGPSAKVIVEEMYKVMQPGGTLNG